MSKKDENITVRFCVGDYGGLRSGEWRIWAKSGKSDVFVAIRTIAHYIKFGIPAKSLEWPYTEFMSEPDKNQNAVFVGSLYQPKSRVSR